MKRNFWALTKGIKVKDIEKAQNHLTTFGIFGQKEDRFFDVPGYEGESEEDKEPKQEFIVFPEDIDSFPLSKEPRDPVKKPKRATKAIETFFMDNFTTHLKMRQEATQEQEAIKARQMESMFEQKLLSLQGQIKADINRKFQIENIADEFAKGFRRNQKKIFGEYSEEEQNLIKKKKLEKQLKDLEKMGDSKQNQAEMERIKAQLIRMRDILPPDVPETNQDQ